jgi:single-strand DNA-binding protein
MSFSVNRVTLLGTLGRDPEVRRTGSGTAVSNLSLATTEDWKDKTSGEWKSKTEWHKVTVWGMEKLVEKLAKGSKVFVEGKLATRKWQDNAGQDKYATEVVVQAGGGCTLVLCDGKHGNGNGSDRSAQTAAGPVAGHAASEDDSDFVPF